MEYTEVLDKQITRKQHYVPKAYLKNFSVSNRKSEQVYVVFANDENAKMVSIDNICCRSYLYDQIAIDPDSKTHVFAAPNEIENSFIELEGEYASPCRGSAHCCALLQDGKDGKHQPLQHPLTFDTRSRTAAVNGQTLTLTRKETGILEYLMVHQGRPVSQEELMDHVWDNSVDSFSNSIRVHISALRKKLRAALGYDPIRNRIGEGYLMGGEEA